MKNFLILTFIIFIAIVTRGYMLGSAPKGLYIDEAGQGYSAYSILLTGKDEFGMPYPAVFRSFIDFKTPVYIYLVTPLIPFFGLNAFTVRLPSFIFSILTFPVLYLLLKKITRNKFLPILVSILLAISPWHILFGRTNFECNVALFFFLAGIYCFYKAIEKPRWFIISAILLAIAVPAYHSQRIVTPLMLLAITIRHQKEIFILKNKNYLIGALVVGLIISIPTLVVSTTPGFLARASGLNIFSHSRQMPAGFIDNLNNFQNSIANNSILLSTKEFSGLYLSYFSPRNMFILGDYGPRSSFPYLSTFFIWQFPFYIIGIWQLIKNKKLGELKFFTIGLLLVSPIPAAVTRDPYTSIRALPLVIPQLIIISLGLIYIYKKLVKYIPKQIVSIIFISLVLYSLLKLYSSVIILNEYYRASFWDYGWEEVTQTIKSFPTQIPVVVDNSRNEPYIHLAFFLQFNPARYQIDNEEINISEYYSNMNRDKTKKFGQIITRPINWEKDLLIEQYLIGDNLSISEAQIKTHNMTLIKEVRYPDQSMAFRIVKTNP